LRFGARWRALRSRPRATEPEGASVRLDDEALPGARSASSGRIATDLASPERALHVAASAGCDFQSTPPSSSRSAANAAHSFSKNPSSH